MLEVPELCYYTVKFSIKLVIINIYLVRKVSSFQQKIKRADIANKNNKQTLYVINKPKVMTLYNYSLQNGNITIFRENKFLRQLNDDLVSFIYFK